MQCWQERGGAFRIGSTVRESGCTDASVGWTPESTRYTGRVSSTSQGRQRMPFRVFTFAATTVVSICDRHAWTRESTLRIVQAANGKDSFASKASHCAAGTGRPM
jgi:hypothetical protein